MSTPQERAFATAIQKTLGTVADRPGPEKVVADKSTPVGMASSDSGDVSWNAVPKLDCGTDFKALHETNCPLRYNDHVWVGPLLKQHPKLIVKSLAGLRSYQAPGGQIIPVRVHALSGLFVLDLEKFLALWKVRNAH
jgi:hypothetical protein